MNISCRPSSCARLSLARTTTATPLPYRIFIDLRPIALRHSGLGNPRLILRQHSFDRLSDTTFIRFCLSQLCCNLFCTQPSKVESSVLQYGVCSYLPPQFRVVPLGLSFNQSRLYPRIYLSSPDSVAYLVTV